MQHCQKSRLDLSPPTLPSSPCATTPLSIYLTSIYLPANLFSPPSFTLSPPFCFSGLSPASLSGASLSLSLLLPSSAPLPLQIRCSRARIEQGYEGPPAAAAAGPAAAARPPRACGGRSCGADSWGRRHHHHQRV